MFRDCGARNPVPGGACDDRRRLLTCGTPTMHTVHRGCTLRTLRKRGIHRLLPGLTGWAQINGRDELPIPVKVGYDHHYLLHRSFGFDLKIIVMTFFKVLRGEGVTH